MVRVARVCGLHEHVVALRLRVEFVLRTAVLISREFPGDKQENTERRHEQLSQAGP